ncbi:MAG: hypothetical protein LAN59_02720 [Acidobacteriia bacterium]|nr:hypothetical protein [Terriglobia bacterium]
MIFMLLGLAWPSRLPAQDTPKSVVEEDCQVFDIAADNSVVYATPRIKRSKQLVIERDDIGIATASGKTRRIVEADKFISDPPGSGYQVDSLSWSPDGHRIAVGITLQKAPPDYHEDTKKQKDENRDSNVFMAAVAAGKAIALLDNEGHEIPVAGSKTRFIENATSATWLADGATVVYLTEAPWKIVRVRPADGQATTLFQGHTFDAVAWDARRNRAFAIGKNLSLTGRLALVELDLVHETVTEIARLEKYESALSVSPSGTKIGFFEDGDTIEVIDTAHPSSPVRVRAGMGRFGWSRDERRLLLKRGSPDRSNDLVWVGLYDGTFTPILHGLTFRDFQIAPDGGSVGVTVPGKRVLKVFALP